MDEKTQIIIERDKELQIMKMREYKVVKDNKLIQTVSRRKFELSVLEQKILGFIISMIKPPENGLSRPEHQIEFDIRLFCRVCGIDFDNGKNYINIKNALKNVADAGFWLEEGDDELYFQWITTPRIKKKSGKVSLRISEDVMPYLFNLQERFTSYELYQILALKRTHSIALYELLKSNAFKGSVKIKLSDLKQYLGVQDNYPVFYDFKRKVLIPSLEEIERYTDLNITYDLIKTGRSYGGIYFHIATKERWAGYAAYQRTLMELNKNKEDYDEIL